MEYTEVRFSELRLDKNLKQKDIAKILGISEDNYSKYERGINDMSLEKSNTLANYYEVSFDYLFGLSDFVNKDIKNSIDTDLMQKRLLKLRKDHGLTQSKLGLKIGFPQTTYAGYEIGRSLPTIFKLYYIALFYDISLDYLLGKTDTMEIMK